MRLPDSLAALSDEGIIEEVVRPLMSGKEAQVYLVVAGGEERVAKIYKDAQNRSFKNRSEYTEGRRVRNSRDERAMSKRTRYGRGKDEDAWRSAEVDVIYRLRDAGVRVPEPFHFVDGVLIMELVKDADGDPAPRLAEVELSRDEARSVFEQLLREVVRMLCAGIVHGDLSDFNVLMGADGPVVIDFPQSIDATRNQNAKEILLRDVNNLITFMSPYDPSVRGLRYGQEIWHAYERMELTPDTPLTGRHQVAQTKTDTGSVLAEIAAAAREEERRRAARGQAPDRRGKGKNRPSAVQQPSESAAARGHANRQPGAVDRGRPKENVDPHGSSNAKPDARPKHPKSGRRRPSPRGPKATTGR